MWDSQRHTYSGAGIPTKTPGVAIPCGGAGRDPELAEQYDGCPWLWISSVAGTQLFCCCWVPHPRERRLFASPYTLHFMRTNGATSSVRVPREFFFLSAWVPAGVDRTSKGKARYPSPTSGGENRAARVSQRMGRYLPLFPQCFFSWLYRGGIKI